MSVDVSFFSGAAMRPHLPALAVLRSQVFRDWPYLYDGAPDTERVYLSELAQSPRAGMAVAFADGVAVGCSTCLPLADAGAAVLAPFIARGLDPAAYFYFGESVLLPAWRGQGIGVAFFAAREAHARLVSDASFACFCAVERAADDKLRPADALPLDAFWRKRGYAHDPGLACSMAWKQVDTADKVTHRLSFWLKRLR